MTTAEFQNLLKTGSQLTGSQLRDIGELISKYPFFTAAQLLMGKLEISNNPENANEFFDQYSVFSHDPVMYRLWINDDTITDTGKDETNQPGFSENEIQVSKSLSGISNENPLYELINSLSELIYTSRLGEVCIFIPSIEKNIFSTQGSQEELLTENTYVTYTITEEPTTSRLIDKFIREEPAISPVKNTQTDFSGTEQRALKSSEYNDDFFLSETLAKIHQRQGNSKKAKNIYEKLQLKFPEKFTYFAGLLKELCNP